MNSQISKFKGGWALISGAGRKEGLGYAFARQLAESGINLVLVDILEGVNAIARELEAEHGVRVAPVVCDLGTTAPYAAIEAVVKDLSIDVLVCNHMLTPTDGPEVLDMPLELHHRLLDVNARAYTNLIHRFGRSMRDRQRGAIIIVGSGAGLTSAPYTSAYSANKAYQIALGESLWFELQNTGVDVLVVVAGLMRTQGNGLDKFPQWMIAEPEDVVRSVLREVGRSHMVFPGNANRWFLWFQTRVLSRRRTVNQIGDFMAKGLGKSR